jgi:hypothetical protein
MIEWYINSPLANVIAPDMLLVVLVCIVAIFGGLHLFFRTVATANDPQAELVDEIESYNWTQGPKQ